MLPIRTILHPTDFSERAHAAFRLACAMARDYGARLVVAHVRPEPVVAYGQGVIPAPPEGESDEEAADRLHAYVAVENAPAEEHVLAGSPVAEILRLAEDTGCDLIVLGTHGWTGLGRLLMGSVAEGVLRRAGCPVLTVRQPFPVTEEDHSALVEEAAGV